MRKQRGISMFGVLILIIIIILGSIGAMKIAPAYMEFYSIKDAVKQVQASGASSVVDVKRAFNKQLVVNNIKAITDADLEITKDGAETSISFAYPVKIHMFNNVSVCIDFAYNTSGAVVPEKTE